LQSWPGIVHGGCLVALVDAAAERLGRSPGPRRIEGRLTSSVPIGTALDLETGRSHDTISLSISQGGQTLASGGVTALGEPPASPAWRGNGAGSPLPMSEQCLACGARNPVGLQVTLAFDAEGVWARFEPREAWRANGDRLHPALAPVLLDEVAWWLGALVMKEGGLTNRLTISLHEPDAPFEGPLVATGRFADVSPIDRKRTFWRTESTLTTASGRLLATASIVFRGGADYSARQVPYFKSRTPIGIFQRMFPNYA
jgi:acyl-coenzyme A thioesterase PaaI-like protein